MVTKSSLGVLLCISFGMMVPKSIAQSRQDSRIYIVDRNGQELKLVADENTMEGRNFLGSPKMSHDGKWVVFDATSGRAFSKAHLLKVCLSGENAGTVADLGTGLGASFSPDDKRIAFFINANNPENAERGTYIMRADGSDRERIGAGISPRWSPDGLRLLCANRFLSPRYLLAYDLPEKNPQRILKDQIVLGLPAWSPDGKRFAATVKDGNNRVLCIFRRDGDLKQRIELWSNDWDDQYEETCPDWSPDGQTILFTFNDQKAGRSRIMTIGTEPNTEPAEVVLAAEGASVRDCTWTADGKRILFAATGDSIRDKSTPAIERKDN